MSRTARSFPKIPKLVNSKPGGARIYTRTVDASVQNLAKRLEGGKSDGRFSLNLVDDHAASYTVHLEGGRSNVSKGKHEEMAEFHMETTKATWMDITSGRVDPVEAYIQGRFRVSGNKGFIKRVYAMAAKASMTDLPF